LYEACIWRPYDAVFLFEVEVVFGARLGWSVLY